MKNLIYYPKTGKITKRFIAFSLAALSATMLSGYCAEFAHAADLAVQTESEYVETVTSRYLLNTDYASMENVSVSNAIPCIDLETGERGIDEYAVFYNDTVIGLMAVGKVDGEYHSSFVAGGFEGIQKVFDESEKALLGFTDEQTFIYNGNSYYDLNSNVPVDVLVESDYSAKMVKTEQKYTDMVPVKQTRGAGSYFCPVEPVPNVGINGGICWAASIAAKYNYVNLYTEGMTGYADALVVYNVVKNVSGNTPVGLPYYVTTGLRSFGLLDSYYNGAIDATSVFAELAWDNPILISVSGTPGTHSLVICGMSVPGDYATYTIVDSNFSDYVYVDGGLGDNSNFQYYNPEEPNAYNGKFTKWIRTYSYKFDR